MSSRSVIGALAGGLGLVVGIVGCAVVAGVVFVALGLPAEGRAGDTPVPVVPPSELVVALSLGDPVLQAGVVRGREVVLARGFEVDLARLIQRRLKVRRIRFVDVRSSARLLTAGVRPWHLGIAAVRSSPRSTGADLSVPYLPSGQAVVPRRGLRPLRSLSDLREKLLCATRGSEGAATIATIVRPAQHPLVVAGDERLLRLVQTGACDAALVDAIRVGALVAGRGGLYGRVVARVDRDDGLVVAVTPGGPFGVDDVDRAIRVLRAKGALGQLARRWLSIDPARLRPLR